MDRAARARRWAITTSRSIGPTDGDEKTIYTGQSFKVDEYKLPTMRRR